MLLPACAPAQEPEASPEPAFVQVAEEAAIRSSISEMIVELNNHDVEGVVARADESAETWEGDLKGKEAFRKMWTDIWGHHKDLQYQLRDEIGIVFVTNDVAIYKTYVDVTGILDEDGNPQPLLRRLFAWILLKKNGRWLWTTWFNRTIEE
jgi:ketosteroid isomerase-like protein